MAVLRQNGSTTTSDGLRKYKPPLCWHCRERREGEIYGLDANGAPICATCRGEAPQKEPDDADGAS